MTKGAGMNDGLTPSIEALGWVKERGGLDAVKESVEQSECRKKLLDCFAMALGFESLEDSGDIFKELEKRLMPDGMEWPRYEGGEPVCIGNEVHIENEKPYPNFDMLLESITISSSGFSLTGADGEYVEFRAGERVKRPKVLAADGNRIEEGMDVWWICDGDERGIHAEKLHVDGIDDDGEAECSPYCGGTSVVLEPSELYVNKPALDANGMPIHEGDTVWCVATDDELEEMYIDLSRGEVSGILTVSRIFSYDGEPWANFAETGYAIEARYLTHTKPDSWERIEEDKGLNPFDYCKKVGHKLWTFDNAEEFKASDLVRRCKALAERGE